MSITFGIITDFSNEDFLREIVQSIEDQNIPKEEYQIFLVGPTDKIYLGAVYTVGCIPHDPNWHWPCELYGSRNVRVYNFDESQKHRWITKKKNIITQQCYSENIVYIHDYVKFLPGWYEGFKSYQGDWDVMMTNVLNKDGTRFRDWLICDDPKHCDPYLWDAKIAPYDYKNTEWMYVSGAYWIAKREFMLKNPLDERLVWGQAEDVEWSKRVRHKWKYVLNTNAKVKLLKQQELALKYVEKPTKGKFTDYFGTGSPFINCSGVIPYNRGAVSG